VVYFSVFSFCFIHSGCCFLSCLYALGVSVRNFFLSFKDNDFNCMSILVIVWVYIFSIIFICIFIVSNSFLSSWFSFFNVVMVCMVCMVSSGVVVSIFRCGMAFSLYICLCFSMFSGVAEVSI